LRTGGAHYGERLSWKYYVLLIYILKNILNMKIITIGRSSDNNVVINDALVSRSHCQIIKDDNGSCRLIDNNSANGTFINGVKQHGEVRLHSSDIIRIGNTTLPWQSYFNNAGGTETGREFAVNRGGYSDDGFTPPLHPQQKGNGFGIAALCCGIVGIVGLLFAGVILGTLAIIFGGVALHRKEKTKGLGITGLVLGIINVAVHIIILIFFGTIAFLFS
jgi:hypothetical protein